MPHRHLQGCTTGYTFSSYTGNDRTAADTLAGGFSIWVNEATVSGLCPYKNTSNALAYQATTVSLMLAALCRQQSGSVGTDKRPVQNECVHESHGIR
jgi:hypothetical protein